jgi:protein phosphatase
MSNPFTWSSAARSHVGTVRELNEDAYLDLGEKGLWAVADGMGGHAVGDVASRLVVETLTELPPPRSLGSFVKDVRSRLRQANRELREEATARGVTLIGSTVAILLAYKKHCVYLWAGDSRIYLLRAGQLTQLSRDHSQVEELIARGLLDRSDADNHPSSNAITRAVGAEYELNLDDEMMQVKGGDMFLLCSDGLYNEVSEHEIATELLRGDCTKAAENLVKLAVDHGARDNVTVVVIRAEDESDSSKTIINPRPPA